MNQLLRQSFRYNSWSRTEGFLIYLRKQGCFSHPAHGNDANPYWYMSCLEYDKFDLIVDGLIKARSIKKARLAEIAEDCVENNLSPTVRLLGLSLRRKVAKMS